MGGRCAHIGAQQNESVLANDLTVLDDALLGCLDHTDRVERELLLCMCGTLDGLVLLARVEDESPGGDTIHTELCVYLALKVGRLGHAKDNRPLPSVLHDVARLGLILLE